MEDYSYIIEFFKKAQERAAYLLEESSTNSDINESYYLGKLDMCDEAIIFLEGKILDYESKD